MTRQILTLKSGKSISANEGIIGIDSLGCIAEGYDSQSGIELKLTTEERIELAEIMIHRWEAFKQLTDKQYQNIQYGYDIDFEYPED